MTSRFAGLPPVAGVRAAGWQHEIWSGADPVLLANLRFLGGLRQASISGLLAGADARWLDMARRVLAEHTEASKPTRDLILADLESRLDSLLHYASS